MAAKKSFVNKDRLREALIALKEEDLAEDLAQVDEHMEAATLDQFEPHESDELSQARDEADKAAFFDQAARAEGERIAHLESLDFGPKTEIGPGAAFTMNGAHYVVATSTRRFDVDGMTFMGISTGAPIYQALEGAAAGETVTMGKRKLKVTAVA